MSAVAPLLGNVTSAATETSTSVLHADANGAAAIRPSAVLRFMVSPTGYQLSVKKCDLAATKSS